MKYYDKYKDSGVPLLGDIPEHWSFSALRWLVRIGSGDFISNQDVTTELGEDNSVPVIGGNGINGYTNSANSSEKTLVIGRVGAHCGNVHLVCDPSWVTDNALKTKITTKKITIKFLTYFLKYLDLNRLANRNAQPLITGEMVKRQFIAFPPPVEQDDIVQFLDDRTAKMDALIAKKEALLQLLAEKRTALITQAVTQGLDPTATRKPSGIEWLGEIPAHWEIFPIKRIVSLINDKIDASQLDDPLPYIGLENITSFTGECLLDEEAKSDGVSSCFKPGDVLFGKLRPYLAKAFLANFYGISSTEALTLRSTPKIIPEHLLRIVLSDPFLKLVNASTYGAKMPRASWDFIGNMEFPLPSVKEQKAIESHLSSHIKHIDNSTSKISVAISKLKEYRVSLITHAVTGKIDVRNHQESPAVYEEI